MEPQAATQTKTPMKDVNRQLEVQARRLLRSPSFFNEYLSAVERAGLVGEWKNALVLLLVAVSRLLPRPMCAFVKGRSSSGKNWLVGRVLSLLPRGRVRELSNASDKALHYSRDHFRHRVLFLQERDESTSAIHPLRLLISESKLIRIVTSWINGERVIKKHVARGPVAAISTTTRVGLEVDDETRHISIFVDDPPEQTRRIVLAHARGSRGLSKTELDVWHTVHRLLENRADDLKIVFPPWFEAVAVNVSVTDVSVRRYFPLFIEACRTVCLIRSFQRSPQSETRQTQLEFADFAIAALILESVFVQSLHRQEGSALEVRQALKDISAKKNGRAVGAEDLARELGISVHAAYRKLRDTAC